MKALRGYGVTIRAISRTRGCLGVRLLRAGSGR